MVYNPVLLCFSFCFIAFLLLSSLVQTVPIPITSDIYISLPFLTGCPSSQFTCDNGNCVNRYQRCNGFDNCGDRSDEINCKNNLVFYTMCRL